MKPITIAIIEDEPIVRKSLKAFLGENPTFELVAVCESVETFLDQLDTTFKQKKPKIILLDIQLPGMTGIEGIRFIKEKLPNSDIIMLTTFEETHQIFGALCAGANSYLSKRISLKMINDAIMTVSRGGSYMTPSIARKVVGYFNDDSKGKPREKKLTERQYEIIKLLVDGLSYKMVAARLDISIDTVRTHIKRIYKKLHINSKAELIRKSLDGDI